MTRKTKVLLWLGAVFASVTVAMLFRVLTGGNGPWMPVVISGTFFACFALAFEPARWCMIAIPGFIATVASITYVRQQPSSLLAWAVLAVVAALGLANVIYIRRPQRS